MNPSYLSSMSPTKEKKSAFRSIREQNFAKLIYRQRVAVASGSDGFQESSQRGSAPVNSFWLPKYIAMSGFSYLCVNACSFRSVGTAEVPIYLQRRIHVSISVRGSD